MPPFRLDFLDHVALLVEDPELSARWYERQLGLRRLAHPEWGGIPIMLLAGKTGIALFPKGDKAPRRGVNAVDHFAFRLALSELQLAKQHLTELGTLYEEQDHVIFLSVYLTDPDGYRVELTAPVRPR